jgi:hypothetical protein
MINNIEKSNKPDKLFKTIQPNKKYYSGSFGPIYRLFDYVHNHVTALNQSKAFAGLIIITLNIASKFVTIKLPKTMESYLKYSFSRDILIFAIAWMGTRDIYTALCIVAVFIIFMDFLFNEDSMFCCLPEQFTNYHMGLLEENTSNPTDEEIVKAKEVLDKCMKQNQMYKTMMENETRK